MEKQLEILTSFDQAWTSSNGVIHTDKSDADIYAERTGTTLTEWKKSSKGKWSEVKPAKETK